MAAQKALDPAKDQSYVLYALTQRQLAHVLFPLGCLCKTEVRAYAAAHGFDNARKPDSQDICFVPDGDYVRFLEEGMGLPNPPGDFLDMQGNPVGTHRASSTIPSASARGLGLAFGEPRFVISKHAAAGTVTLGRQEDLFTRTLFAEDVNLISLPELTEPVRVTAKTRYSQAAAPALLESSGGFPYPPDLRQPPAGRHPRPGRRVLPGRCGGGRRDDCRQMKPPGQGGGREPLCIDRIRACLRRFPSQSGRRPLFY